MNPEKAHSDSVAEIEKLKRERDEAFRAAQAAVRDASRVNRILTILNDPAPLETLLEEIINTVSELFSAEIVVLFDPGGSGNWFPVAAIGLPEDYQFETAPRGHIASFFETYLTATVIAQETIHTNPLFSEIAQMLGVKNAIWIPMRGSRELRGALILARCSSISFTRQEMDLLSALGSRIARTLERVQNESQLEYIIRGNQKIGRHLDKNTISEEAVRTFSDMVKAEGAVLFNCRGSDPILCSNLPQEANKSQPEWGFLAQFLSRDQTILTGEATSTTINSDCIPFPPGLPEFPYREVLTAPLFRDGQLHNLLCAFRSNAVHFTSGTKQIATLYSAQIAAALEKADLYEALREELQERLSVEASLRESREQFKALLRNISAVIAVLNVDRTIKYVGDTAAKSLWGQTGEELVGTTLFDRVHPDDLEMLTKVFEKTSRSPGQNISAIVRMRYAEADNWRYFDVILTNLLHDFSVKGIVATFHDVTEHKISENKLTQLACLDPLTGLANRASFLDHLHLTLKYAGEQSTQTAIIFFDLDNFKRINDTFGHAAGDEILKTFAKRMKECLRPIDIAARLGGDEFTILIREVDSIDKLSSVLDRLLASLMKPIVFNDTAIKVGGSIGVAMSVPHEDDAESLLHKADLAMYRAKRAGKGRYIFYDPSFEKALRPIDPEPPQPASPPGI